MTEPNKPQTAEELAADAFELQEYRRAMHCTVKMVMIEMDGMPGCMALVIDAAEPVHIQPGMQVLIKLP